MLDRQEFSHDEIVSCTRDRLAVALVNIGEGFYGDFDPSDPDDVPLLRLDVYAITEAGQWEQLDFGSACTQIDAGTPKLILQRLLESMTDRIAQELGGDGASLKEPERWSSVKTIVESLSYTGPNEIAHIRKTIEARGELRVTFCETNDCEQETCHRCSRKHTVTCIGNAATSPRGAAKRHHPRSI